MCGIVGLIIKAKNGFSKNHETICANLLYANAVRGYDATGVIGVTNQGEFTIMKEASPSAYFAYNYDGSETEKMLFSRGVAFIGHNRAKTIGENKDENAHPFVIDDTFAMVHNGTLRNHHKLAKTIVDSEALATVLKEAMDQDDYKTALEETLSKVEGAYACVWYDQKRDEVCMVRNKERPLSLLETVDGTIFSSEAGLGVWVSQRNGSKVENVVSVPENTLIRFDMKKGGATYDQIPLTLKPPVTTGGFQNGATTVAPITPFKSVVRDIFKKSKHGDVSKNEFKRMRNKFINKELKFVADDWVEAKLFTPSPNEFIIMGESKDGSFDLCDFKHLVKTTVSLSDLCLSQKQMENTVNWMGIISNIEYNPKFKSVELTLRDCSPNVLTPLLTLVDSPTVH